jgi:hypothetical protein
VEIRVYVKAMCEVSFELKTAMTAILTLALEACMFNPTIFMTYVVLISVFVGVVSLRPWLGLQLERKDITWHFAGTYMRP